MTQQEVTRLGRRIAQRRRSLGMGLRTLAQQAEVDHTWLYRLEQGEFADPDANRLARVLETLTLTPTRDVQGHLAARLPEMPIYFRAKYHLTPEQVAQVERYVDRLRRQT